MATLGSRRARGTLCPPAPDAELEMDPGTRSQPGEIESEADGSGGRKVPEAAARGARLKYRFKESY